MLLKNFGITRHDRVVFYDYDEIQPIGEVSFRRIPPARSYEEELAAEPYWRVGEGDVFPEQFDRFLVSDPRAREIFYEYHRDLLDPAFWAGKQERVRAGSRRTSSPTPRKCGFLEGSGGHAQRPDREQQHLQDDEQDRAASGRRCRAAG